MDPIAIASASGLRTRVQALDILANNIANSSTAGFKSDHEFSSLFDSIDGEASAQNLTSANNGWTDFSQGTILPSGNPLNFALSGPGLFAVDGKGGQLYTRNGSFIVSTSGELMTTEGYPVRAKGGGRITLAPGVEVKADAQGRLSQNGQPVGQLEIVRFQKPTDLGKQGANYYKTSGPGIKSQESEATVTQAALEGSNVSTAEATVRLVNVMRHYESLQKAVSLSTEMSRKAIEEVARVSGS